MKFAGGDDESECMVFAPDDKKCEQLEYTLRHLDKNDCVDVVCGPDAKCVDKFGYHQCISNTGMPYKEDDCC